jgi:exodeoxyribonuclease-5
VTDPTLDVSQAAALDRIAAWFRLAPRPRYCDGGCDGATGPHTHGRSPAGHPVLAVGGLAGTGKTWLAGHLAGALGAEVAYGTPTHQAAAVLRRKLPADQAEHVRTYHSLLYRALATYTCGVSGLPVTRLPCGCADPDDCRCERRFTACDRGARHECPVRENLSFQLRRFVGGHRDLIVLDEASMVADQTVEEIRSLGLPVLLVGDHGQLPPVQASLNHWLRVPELLLDVNHRQGEASGIVAAALRVRAEGALPRGSYGDGSTYVGSAALRPQLLELASPARLPASPAHVVICHTNRLRAAVNRGYRTATAPLVAGDRVVALENADRPILERTGAGGLGSVGEWSTTGAATFVFNGATGTVADVAEPLRQGQAWRDVAVTLDADERGQAGTTVLTRLAVPQLGGEAKLRPDERAEGHALWDYAYALTAHKAQGSEFSRVVVLDTHPLDWQRWLYTAMTRAREKLVVLNWSRT